MPVGNSNCSPKSFGIAHHSPLDVEALVPVGTRVVLHPHENGDVLFSRKLESVPEGSSIRFQMVFASTANLERWKLRKIDCDSNGKMIRLTAKVVDYLMQTKAEIIRSTKKKKK